VQDTDKNLIEMGVAAWIYMWPGGSHFVLEFSALFQRIENELTVCHTPFWQGFKLQLQICVS